MPPKLQPLDVVGEPYDDTGLVERMVEALPALHGYWDRSLRCRFANRAYEQSFGVPANALLGMRLETILGPTIFELNRPHVEGVLRGERQSFLRTVPDPEGGERRTALVHFVPDFVGGEVVGYFVQATDVSALLRPDPPSSVPVARPPSSRPACDALTGLPGLALVEEQVARALRMAAKVDRLVALLRVQLDDFDTLPLTHGSAAAGSVLCQAASRVTGVLRRSDTVARVGDSGFLVLVPGLDRAGEAESVAAQILEVLGGAEFDTGASAVAISASIGVAVSPRDGDTLEQLVQKADAARVAASRAGGARVSTYAPPSTNAPR